MASSHLPTALCRRRSLLWWLASDIHVTRKKRRKFRIWPSRHWLLAGSDNRKSRPRLHHWPNRGEIGDHRLSNPVDGLGASILAHPVLCKLCYLCRVHGFLPWPALSCCNCCGHETATLVILHVSAVGFAAAFGGGGAAVFPFAVGAIAQAKGVQVLQPIALALLAAIMAIWVILPGGFGFKKRGLG